MSERNDIQSFLTEYKKQVYEEANKLMYLSMPELTEELFSQFERTGNRLLYENVYFSRRKFLTVIGLMALLEKNGNRSVSNRTLRKLIHIIDEICSEVCWALPAHLSRANEGWENTVDLFAAETAQTLSELADHLKGDLPSEIYTLIVQNVERRVLRPFFSSSAYGWEKSDHNWNAVCTGSIGSACIHLREKSEETDVCLKRICDSLIYYIEGFADDGTCMEGCSYFTYGMSYFVNFAQELFDYSEGRIDLLRGDWEHFRKGERDKRGRIASFQSKCFFPDGTVVNFSDGNSRDKFSLGLNLALKSHFPEVSIPDLRSAADLLHDHCYRFVFRKLDLFETEKYLQRIQNCEADTAVHNAHSSLHILPNAQWCIASVQNGVGFGCKGGHNGEPHNHNDVGHFIYEGNGTAFLADLGAGEYTRDYFGEKRYEILCNNSFGHSVPIACGRGQTAGKKHGCYRFDTEATDGTVVVDMDLSGAYGENPGVISRKLKFSLSHGELKVMDRFLLPENTVFSVTENLITNLKPVVEKDSVLLTDGTLTAVLTIHDAYTIAAREYPHSNHQGKQETVYAIRWAVCPEKRESSFEIRMVNA